MVASIALQLLALLAGSSSLLLPQAAAQQQAAGTPLFLNEPSCDSYQCAIIWQPGQTATANWLDAPQGDVVLDLMKNAGADVAYNIATVPGISQAGYCDAGSGVGVQVTGTTCGSFSFIVPGAWADGNYTMRATSKADSNLQSYTDVILIQSNGSSSTTAAFSTVPISGALTATVTGDGTVSQPSQSPTAPVTPGASNPASSSASTPVSSSGGSSRSAIGSSSRTSASGSSSASGASPSASGHSDSAAALSDARHTAAVLGAAALFAIAVLL